MSDIAIALLSALAGGIVGWLACAVIGMKGHDYE